MVLLWGAGTVSVPLLMMFVGKQRRASLKERDEERAAKVLKHVEANISPLSVDRAVFITQGEW